MEQHQQHIYLQDFTTVTFPRSGQRYLRLGNIFIGSIRNMYDRNGNPIDFGRQYFNYPNHTTLNIGGLPLRVISFSHLKTPNKDDDVKPCPPKKDMSTEPCSVCLDLLLSDYLRCHPCHHYFHKSCIKKWTETHSNCPYCRGEIKSFCIL